jgi:GNAT superfamily N-acetyltransferase
VSEGQHLKLVTFEGAEHFLSRCESWLLERSDVHNTMYSSASLIRRECPVFTGPYWFGAIEDDSGDIVACGSHNLPDGLCISEIPESMLDAVHRSLVDAVGVPHRIMAPQTTAEYLAERCSDTSKVCGRFQARWHLYRLDNLIWPVKDIPGQLRKGRNEEADLISRWGRAFGEEQPAPVDVSEFMLRKLSEGDLYVWDNSGAKTILSLSGRAGKGIQISGVYTPPEFRGGGYASAAVAALSYAELSNGRDFLVLNVIDGNPAEALYQRLGYRRIGSSDCFLMDK